MVRRNRGPFRDLLDNEVPNGVVAGQPDPIGSVTFFAQIKEDTPTYFAIPSDYEGKRQKRRMYEKYKDMFSFLRVDKENHTLSSLDDRDADMKITGHFHRQRKWNNRRIRVVVEEENDRNNEDNGGIRDTGNEENVDRNGEDEGNGGMPTRAGGEEAAHEDDGGT